MKIHLLTARIPPTRCGVGDYTTQLANEMARMGHEVAIVTAKNQADSVPGSGFRVLNVLSSWGPRGMRTLWRTVRREKPDLLYVQWVSQLYSIFGINLSLPVTILLLGLSGVRVRIVVHEPWVGFESPFLMLIGPIQRLALGIMMLVSERTSVSIEKWTVLLKLRFFWKAHTIHCIPVGSNFSVCSVSAEEKRQLKARFQIPQSDFVVGVFGVNRTPKDIRLIERLWNELKKRDHDYCLLAMGFSEADVSAIFSSLKNDRTVKATGLLTPKEVSQLFQTIDVLIAPFTDGVSTRRTTVISALAHGVPVLSNSGKSTDRRTFDYSPIVQVAYYPEDFAKAIDRYRRAPHELAEIGREGKPFYEKYFSWRAIAEKILAGIEPRNTTNLLPKSGYR